MIRSVWPAVSVRTLVNQGTLFISDGFRAKSSQLGTYGIPFVRGGDIGNGWIETTVNDHVLPEFKYQIEVKLTQPGDVAFITKGTVGRTGRLRPDQPVVVFAPQVCYWRSLNAEELDPRYVFYLLCSRWFQSQLDGVKTSGSMVADYVSLSDQQHFELPIPPIGVQRRIASILGALDDKIELNRQMNRTLEAMAQALFKSWFVDFDGHADLVDSELGPIPRGWGVVRASELAEVSIGKTPPRKEPEWFSTDPGDVRWMSIKDLGACGAYITETAEHLTQEAIERHRVKRIPDNTVVLSFKLTVGRVAITEGEMCSNEAIAHFRLPKGTPLSQEYLYSYLKSFRYDDLGSTSSIATAVNSKVIRAMPVLVPERPAVKRFDAAVQPIFRKLKCLAHESRTLAKLRDTLLPKLISGELRVPEAEQLAEVAS